MKLNEVLRLREQWLIGGQPECRHPVFEIIDDGCDGLGAAFACVVCGRGLPHQPTWARPEMDRGTSRKHRGLPPESVGT
jgi:diadenosine tetraphosphatase ApaH/serine/threonine PP2A family protein phosphatase